MARQEAIVYAHDKRILHWKDRQSYIPQCGTSLWLINKQRVSRTTESQLHGIAHRSGNISLAESSDHHPEVHAMKESYIVVHRSSLRPLLSRPLPKRCPTPSQRTRKPAPGLQLSPRYLRCQQKFAPDHRAAGEVLLLREE